LPQQRDEIEDEMTRCVIALDAVLHLAATSAAIRAEHQLLAPTLLRSEVLSLLYWAVRRKELSRKEAERRLEYIRKLRLRLLGDRVLQDVAWRLAEELRWSDTLPVEYLALTQLQADALVTLDAKLAKAARTVVRVAAIEDLLAAPVTSRTGCQAPSRT
jgi:predicted nucleic acid-binding protein